MGSQKTSKPVLHRVNTRIYDHQDSFIKSESRKSKGKLSEGEVHRQLLDEAITRRKNIKNGDQ